jgi:hypothetical protein
MGGTGAPTAAVGSSAEVTTGTVAAGKIVAASSGLSFETE